MQVHEHSPFENTVLKRRIPTDIVVRYGEFDDFCRSCATYEGVDEDGGIIAGLNECRLRWIERGSVDGGPI